MSQAIPVSSSAELWSMEWINRLVSLDTVSRISNLPVIEIITAELDRLGINYQLYPTEDGKKANLFATIPASDGSVDDGIILSGHSDVVPVDGQDWKYEPFSTTESDGLLYGRGTCDMKGFVAIAVAALGTFASRSLTRPLHLAVSYDEEVGCIGGGHLADAIASSDANPSMCIVGEPTMMRVIRAHKSINSFRVHFTGVAAHSSLKPLGVNAIEYAARFTNFWRDLTDDFKDYGPYDDAFDVAYTTGGVNVIRGGEAGNIVPEKCGVEFEFRTIAEDDPEVIVNRVRDYLRSAIEPRMKAENPDASVELETISQVRGLDTPADSGVRALCHQLGGVECEDKVSYATEAGQFAGVGIDTVVCGPGSIEQAHKANEFISLDQIRACEQFMMRLADTISR